MSSLMNKLAGILLIISGLLLIILIIIGIYVIYGYFGIKNDLALRENKIARPQIEEGSIVSPGYIESMTKSSCIKTRKARIFWQVEIPTLKKSYLCEWRYGFAGFKKGDKILLIINPSKADAPSKVKNYLVGKQGDIMEKAAAVKTIYNVPISDRVD